VVRSGQAKVASGTSSDRRAAARYTLNCEEPLKTAQNLCGNGVLPPSSPPNHPRMCHKSPISEHLRRQPITQLPAGSARLLPARSKLAGQLVDIVFDTEDESTTTIRPAWFHAPGCSLGQPPRRV